ncbi:MAG: transposase [Bacteroidales bacterium]|nr:transposase [Bacteroidales bacterium]
MPSFIIDTIINGQDKGGFPSPQLYEYRYEKVQELERQHAKGRITLFYADESHICTEGYVPYGWQLPGEEVCIFDLPPYSPHLNIAETLWRILKGKWIRPQDYVSIDTLFYTTNSALAAVGKGLFIN